MARGYAQSRSELPSGFEASRKDIAAYERENDIREHGESYYGDNELELTGAKTDEQLDAAGVKHPLVREFLKDPVAMKKISRGFTEVEMPESAGDFTDSKPDYAWNGQRDVYLGSTPTGWRPGEWEITSDNEAPTVQVKYKGQYFEVQAGGVIDASDEESNVIDLTQYDGLGMSFANSSKSLFERRKDYEDRRNSKVRTAIDLDA